MPMARAAIEQRLRAAFPDAEIVLDDLAGDEDHWALTIRSAAFDGIARVRAHRMVHDALGGALGGELHALQIVAQGMAGQPPAQTEGQER